MPQTLLLRLPSAGEQDTEWLTIDAGGLPATTRQRGPLALAAAVGRTANVVVLAPATQILLAEPQLPPGSGVKLARAVPFALEEQLTQDIDELNFAIGRRRADGGTPVAVVTRSVLTEWLSSLRTAGLDPSAVYPDISFMPENPGQTVLWLEKERLAVRRPGSVPFAVELSPVSEALAVAGIIADPLDASSTPKTPESIVLYATREDWANAKREFEALADNFESLRVQLLGDGPLPWLAGSIEDTDAVNLLQGEFAPTTDYGARWREWRVAAALAAGLLVAHVGAQALQIRHANRASAGLDGQVASVFAEAMPAEAMQDPRGQMQSRLDRIRKSGVGPAHFLHSLQTLSGALAVTPKTSINTLSYREEALDLKVSAPSLASLSQLSQVLAKQGMSAEIQSSTPVATGVEAHLQIRPQTKPKNR